MKKVPIPIVAVLLLALAVLFLNCRGKDSFVDRKAVTQTLKGNELMVENLLDSPGICAVYQDYIFLRFNRDTSRLVAYQLSGDSLKFFCGLVDRGRGPQEVIYSEYSLYGDTLFFSNGSPSGISQFYGVSLSDMTQIADRSRWKEYAFPKPEMMTWQTYTGYGPGRFLIAGGDEGATHFLTLADCASAECSPICFWPNDNTSVPPVSKQMVYADCRLCSQGDLVCYAHQYSRYLSIFKIEDNTLVEKALIYPRLPKYELDQDGRNIRYVDSDNSGIKVYTTPDFVFAQLGRTSKEIMRSELYKGYPETYFDELEVYDWSGRFIANYQTDRPFVSFAVSPDNRNLFTKTVDPETLEPILMRYVLPL